MTEDLFCSGIFISEAMCTVKRMAGRQEAFD